MIALYPAILKENVEIIKLLLKNKNIDVNKRTISIQFVSVNSKLYNFIAFIMT